MRRKKSKRGKLGTWLVILGLFGGFYLLSSKQEVVKRIVKKTINYTKLQVKETYSSKLKDKMPAYIESVAGTGIVPCRNGKLIKSHPNLFKVEDRRYYQIDHLDYSHPYLTQKGLALLNKIAENFGKKIASTDLHDSKFIVTSLTRSKENVRRLRRNNGNASERSAHLYGGCFDITYARFSNAKKYLSGNDVYRLKETLAEVIYELKKRDKCWAITEKNQPCFHVVCK